MALLPGKTISHFFYVRSLSNRILVPDANPTAVLIRGAIDTVVPVSVSSTVDGAWVAQATLPSNWVEGDVVFLRISAVKDGYTMSDTIKLGTVDPDNSTKLSTIDINARIAKQGITNRYKIDETVNTGTLYADDGVTPIVVQVLKDKDGNPASTQTYERVPQ